MELIKRLLVMAYLSALILKDKTIIHRNSIKYTILKMKKEPRKAIFQQLLRRPLFLALSI